MDEILELKGISFIWDGVKVRKNLSKHGVSFEQAAEVFFDPFLRVIDASPNNEIRDAVIGMDKPGIFYTSFISLSKQTR